MDPESSAVADGALLSDDRGSIATEYAVVLCVVALACAVALIALGGPLVRTFSSQVSWLLLPVP